VKVATVCTGAADDGGVLLLCERHLNAAVLRLRPKAAPLDSRVAPLAVGEPLIGVESLG
jgi:hypothetical protein